MILLLTTNGLDKSTEDIIDWLEYYNKKWIRINGEDYFKKSINEIKISNDPPVNTEFNLKNIKVVFSRRWISFDYFFEDQINNLLDVDSKLYSVNNAFILKRTLIKELSILSAFFFKSLSSLHWIPKSSKMGLNKLIVLKAAVGLGLKIPETIVTNNKIELLKFKKKHKHIITKPIYELFIMYSTDNKYSITTLNKLVSNEEIQCLGNQFFPMKFQEFIHKTLEIRCFYFDYKWYSMAIFSQNNTKTKVDFRNYDFDFPNRTVRYKLPDEIEKKLEELFNELDLNTGSVDLMINENGEYVFLEINPVGQFGMTSHPCNYNLDKVIADTLIKYG